MRSHAGLPSSATAASAVPASSAAASAMQQMFSQQAAAYASSSEEEDSAAQQRGWALMQEQRRQREGGLVFEAGALVLPHPDKVEKGGEDGFFIAASGRALGIADGVGGWAEAGIDAGV